MTWTRPDVCARRTVPPGRRRRKEKIVLLTYCDKKNSSAKKKCYSKIKKIAIRAATAAIKAAAAAKPVNSPATSKSPAANDDASTEDSENDDLREFLALDDEAQTARKKEKVSLASYKKKEKEGAEAEEGAVAEASAEASATSGKKNSSASSKSDKYRGKSGKCVAKARTSKPQGKSAFVDCNLHIGSRVLGFWPKDDGTDEGEWFEGHVQGIDYVEQTVDILYNDGDRDDAVPWDKTHILDPITGESDG